MYDDTEVFGRPFVKGLPYAIGQLSCLSVLFCLSVTLVYCGQTVGSIRMPLGVEVSLGPGYTVLDGDLAPPRKGAQHPPHFSGHVCCGPNGRPSQ